MYASQGWAGFPDLPTDPAQLGCDFFTQVDARVPFPRARHRGRPRPRRRSSTARWCDLPAASRSAPCWTCVPSTFDVRPGKAFTVKVSVTAPSREPLGRSAVALRVPDGWKVSGSGDLGRLAPGRTGSATFTVTPAGAPGDRARVAATLTTERGGGYTDRQVEVSPAVRGGQQALPQVEQYEKWVGALGVPQLRGLVAPVLTLPSGGSREVGSWSPT
ncbi:hypothetical protein GCM10020219_075310 [Nonomuraea dietziae]